MRPHPPRSPRTDPLFPSPTLYASALVRDGGTLQVGIGALSDALCHALALRHVDNAAYRRVLAALDPALEHHPAVIASGGLGPFEQGLYGCSEMINERAEERRVGNKGGSTCKSRWSPSH